MPTAMQQAAGSTPGWEDWDGDGQPGITGSLTVTVTGRIFVAPRQWTDQQGAVPNVTTAFTLPVTWDQEQNVMAYDPPTNFTLGLPAVMLNASFYIPVAVTWSLLRARSGLRSF